MSTNRLLLAVLESFREYPDYEQTKKILSTTTSLLTTLSNPLNITLLISHFIRSSALWYKIHEEKDHVAQKTCMRVMRVFNTAAIEVYKHQLEGPQPNSTIPSGGLSCDAWATAILTGLEENPHKWIHSLVIAGVLSGMEGRERHALSSGMRLKLEEAMVFAANCALPMSIRLDAVLLALVHTFGLISDDLKKGLDYDRIATHGIDAIVFGYEGCAFLCKSDSDIIQVVDKKFGWTAKSESFVYLQKVASKPIVTAIGPLSRLVAHAAENSKDPMSMLVMLDSVASLASKLPRYWKRNKLSEIDISEEGKFLTSESRRVTIPALWKLLQTFMFATVVILRSVVSRTLVDPALATLDRSSEVATNVLRGLLGIHFISSRLGTNALSAYTFVFLGAADILSQSPSNCTAFLESIREIEYDRYNPYDSDPRLYPRKIGAIPLHPVDRIQNLYFLNLAEHLTPTLPPSFATDIIYPVIQPYLSPTALPSLMEIFEAAHSAMLAILSSPQNSDIAKEMLPGYVEAVFASFPTNLSSTQFRIAFKTLVGIVTPPNWLAASEEGLVETLLEVLRHRALDASTLPLPLPITPKKRKDKRVERENDKPLSEQAVLILTLIDALPSLPVPILEEWLPLSAELLNKINDPWMREACKERFWEVLNNGEMDVDRSPVCLAWWTTRGGKEKVLYGVDTGSSEEYLMSGGLGLSEELTSRL